MLLKVRKLMNLAGGLGSKLLILGGGKPRKALDVEVAIPETKSLPVNQSRFGPSLHIRGEVSGTEALFIEGAVEGLIHLESQNVILSPESKVNADIIAGDVMVRGKLKGNVRATCRIAISKEGSVNGSLTTPEILIEDGAFFKGSIEIENRAEKETLPPTIPSVHHGGVSKLPSPIKSDSQHGEYQEPQILG